MTGIVDWAAGRARMILAFVFLSILAGAVSYVGLPKEGEPDIEVPALFISVPFPGISAEDAEKLLVKPMEQELRDLDGLDVMGAVAQEGYAGLFLEFEFGWDKQATLAEARDAMNNAEADFPDGAEQYSINELNFSEIPILVVSLSGAVPERTLTKIIKDLQDDIESLAPVLQAALSGGRDEMVEVLIDPLKLEAYNVTAGELANVVRNNNQLIAAGEVEGATGAFSIKIPSAFDSPQDVMDLPVKVNGDRLITLGDLADIRLTFEDADSTARYNGETTFALQVSKRKGFNVIDTAAEVRAQVEESVAAWPAELQDAVTVSFSMDTSAEVASMVNQLEASVLTAIALVMIVVLSSLGIRSALLVGFAIPTSFLLCFAILAVFGISISNIVMFGLILAVGMLVDGAIVVVEYADKEIQRGVGPMTAYRHAAKRMFWPIISSTATTLCAFLPMLFWPGVAGEFMGNLPVTLIFVLSASLVVALVYLPVVGGVAGRLSRIMAEGTAAVRASVPWAVRLVLALIPVGGLYGAFMMLLAPDGAAILPGLALFIASWAALSLFGGSLLPAPARQVKKAGYRRSIFGRLIHFISGNPVMPFVSIAAVILFVMSVFSYFGENNNGVEFFVETEPERAVAYVRARGNLSLDEKDALVREVEQIILEQPGVRSVFAFAGSGGLTQGPGAGGPIDTVGQVQIELEPWDVRYAQGAAGKGKAILATVNERLAQVPGIEAELAELAQGPPQGKPVFLRLTGANWDDLLEATATARAKFDETPTLANIEDTRPLPGIDWQIDVDTAAAGRYGADVATVGAMVQLVTRGLTLDTMRLDTSDDEVDIRVRLPEDKRTLSTLDTLRVRTNLGLVPLSNFISRKPVPKLAQIDRINGERYFDVKADIEDGKLALTTQSTPEEEGAEPDVVQHAVIEELTPEALDDDPRPRITVTNQPLLPFLGAPSVRHFAVDGLAEGETVETVQALVDSDAAFSIGPVTPSERIAVLTEWIETQSPFPAGVNWEWTGEQEDQEESFAFLTQAFAGALGLMFVILLAQFNSIYNSVLVLVAVVLSVTGCLIGMIVMGQPFSVIMTGTGIVALAGIVVNNNIVLIDTYQEYARYMPRLEAITRTAEARIRPVLLTTITTMAGLSPMMFGLSVDFFRGGYTIDAPTALWWKQLATAVVFGLGLATVLTLIVTPALLSVRVWATKGAYGAGVLALSTIRGGESALARDRRLARAARKAAPQDVQWEDGAAPPVRLQPAHPQAAE